MSSAIFWTVPVPDNQRMMVRILGYVSMAETTLYRYPHRRTSLAIHARCAECERSRDNALDRGHGLPATKLTGNGARNGYNFQQGTNRVPRSGPVFHARRLHQYIFDATHHPMI